jgi:MraZ protein
VDRFLSHYANRFDAKGRISVPAPFRAVLAKEDFEGVFAHPSLDSPALDCGGNIFLDEIHGLLDSMPPYSRDREDLATALLGTGEILRFDSEGRIMLGERMRSSIGLRDEAMFVGQGRKFQIWEPNRFAAHLEEAKARVRRLRSEMGPQMTRGARE